jgi:hypothetical protein
VQWRCTPFGQHHANAAACPLPHLPTPQGPLQEVAQLQQALVSHKVSAHESLERLATGLYRHMEQASDGECSQRGCVFVCAMPILRVLTAGCSSPPGCPSRLPCS